MATLVGYTPVTVAGRALFNFDDFGYANYKYSGTVNISVSDAFTYSDYVRSYSTFSVLSGDVYTDFASGSAGWTSTQLSNIQQIANTFTNFANVKFSNVTNYSGFTPAQVGDSSDVNISLIYRSGLEFSGETDVVSDASFGYSGGRGDIVLNVRDYLSDLSFSTTSWGGHTLMHEIGHALGLSHPHKFFIGSTAYLTSEFAATSGLGFTKLGFHINSPQDMNKEYFSIMSYDDEFPPLGVDTFAQTPMILDVLALQEAYGRGTGSSGAGNDVVTVGGGGGVNAYRTYYDTGGIDTVDLSNYGGGAYLHLGTAIVGANYPVGVSMSRSDAITTVVEGGTPTSLRWFYGDFENATGSLNEDFLLGNDLNNAISGLGGNDNLFGGAGDDFLDGGAGRDVVFYSGLRSEYSISNSRNTFAVSGPEGSDSLVNVEYLRFADDTLRLEGNLGIVEKADFNGDGRMDLVMRHVTGFVELLQMSGVNYAAYCDYGYTSGWQIESSSGDYNGDGKTDIIFRNNFSGTLELLQMNGVNYAAYRDYSYSTDWQLASGTADVNGDGKDDLILRNDQTETIEVLQMNGVNSSGVRDITFSAQWDFVSANADVNGDGKSDLIMQKSNGTLEILQMNGILTPTTLDYGYSDGWKLEGLGDFNGDGKTDLVLQNKLSGTVELLQMNGVNYSAFRDYGYSSGWQVVETKGDYNGDGKSDLVMQNSISGMVEVLLMNGVNYTAFRDYAYSPGWKVVDAKSDFNGDGKSDLLFRNNISGTVELLQMNGVNYTAFRDYGYTDQWQVATTGDMNADGKADIVMRSTSGIVEILEMNGSNYTAYRDYAYGQNWEIPV